MYMKHILGNIRDKAKTGSMVLDNSNVVTLNSATPGFVFSVFTENDSY
jgi:hypothetical protein